MEKRILVVDFEASDLAALERALRAQGMTSVVTHALREALERWEDGSPDALLVSVDPAETRHRDVVRAVRQHHGPDVPILFFGRGETTDPVRAPSEAIAQGGDYFFRVPCDFDYLAGRVKAWAERGARAPEPAPMLETDPEAPVLEGFELTMSGWSGPHPILERLRRHQEAAGDDGIHVDWSWSESMEPSEASIDGLVEDAALVAAEAARPEPTPDEAPEASAPPSEALDPATLDEWGLTGGAWDEPAAEAEAPGWEDLDGTPEAWTEAGSEVLEPPAVAPGVGQSERFALLEDEGPWSDGFDEVEVEEVHPEFEPVAEEDEIDLERVLAAAEALPELKPRDAEPPSRAAEPPSRAPALEAPAPARPNAHPVSSDREGTAPARPNVEPPAETARPAPVSARLQPLPTTRPKPTRPVRSEAPKSRPPGRPDQFQFPTVEAANEKVVAASSRPHPPRFSEEALAALRALVMGAAEEAVAATETPTESVTPAAISAPDTPTESVTPAAIAAPDAPTVSRRVDGESWGEDQGTEPTLIRGPEPSIRTEPVRVEPLERAETPARAPAKPALRTEPVQRAAEPLERAETPARAPAKPALRTEPELRAAEPLERPETPARAPAEPIAAQAEAPPRPAPVAPPPGRPTAPAAAPSARTESAPRSPTRTPRSPAPLAVRPQTRPAAPKAPSAEFDAPEPTMAMPERIARPTRPIQEPELSPRERFDEKESTVDRLDPLPGLQRRLRRAQRMERSSELELSFDAPVEAEPPSALPLAAVPSEVISDDEDTQELFLAPLLANSAGGADFPPGALTIVEQAELQRTRGQVDEAVAGYALAAQIYVDNGMKEPAVALYRRILDCLPGHPLATERLRRLEPSAAPAQVAKPTAPPPQAKPILERPQARPPAIADLDLDDPVFDPPASPVLDLADDLGPTEDSSFEAFLDDLDAAVGPTSQSPSSEPEDFPLGALRATSLAPDIGDVWSLSDLIDVFLRARAQRSTGVLRFRGGPGILLAHGVPSGLMGEEVLPGFLRLAADVGWLGESRARQLLEEGREMSPRAMARWMRRLGYVDGEEELLLPTRQLEDRLIRVLQQRGGWLFEPVTGGAKTDDLVPRTGELRDWLVELLPRACSEDDLRVSLGLGAQTVRIIPGTEHFLPSMEAPLAQLLDGRRGLEEAARLGGVPTARALAWALVWLAEGLAERVDREVDDLRRAPERRRRPAQPGPSLADLPPLRPRRDPQHQGFRLNRAPTSPRSPIPMVTAEESAEALALLDAEERVRAMAERVRTKDYFGILDVEPNASRKAIDDAHRRIRKLVPQDVSGDLEHMVREVLRSVDEARDILMIPELRAAYEHHLEPQ